MKKLCLFMMALCLVLFSGIMISCSSGGGGDDDEDEPGCLCFTAEADGSSVATKINGSIDPLPKLLYSRDGAVWDEFVIGTTKIDLNKNEKVYLRAEGINSTFSRDYNKYIYFVMTGNIAASGNIMSLVDSSCKSKKIPCDYCFYGLFDNCNSLTKAPALPATELTKWCYCCLFIGCKSLIKAPVLPATKLAEWCYSSIFEDCVSLTTAPALNATTLVEGCYNNFFSNCKSLTKAPVLNAKTLASSCYGWMFAGCESLTSAPALPVTKLADSCYYGMFANCKSLTKAPVLPAKTLDHDCYSYMFRHCSNLASVDVSFTDWNESGCSTEDWLKDVASSGTFTCPKGLGTGTRDSSHVPGGWTVKNK